MGLDDDRDVSELLLPFNPCDPCEPFDPPPRQTIHGRSSIWEQDCPSALQKSDPPFAHSVPSHTPPTLLEDCEEALKLFDRLLLKELFVLCECSDLLELLELDRFEVCELLEVAAHWLPEQGCIVVTLVRRQIFSKQRAVKLEQSMAQEPSPCPTQAVQAAGGLVQSAVSSQCWGEEDCEEAAVHSLPSQGKVYEGPSVNMQVLSSHETIVWVQVREQEAKLPLQDVQVVLGMGHSETSLHWKPVVEDADFADERLDVEDTVHSLAAHCWLKLYCTSAHFPLVQDGMICLQPLAHVGISCDAKMPPL